MTNNYKNCTPYVDVCQPMFFQSYWKYIKILKSKIICTTCQKALANFKTLLCYLPLEQASNSLRHASMQVLVVIESDSNDV